MITLIIGGMKSGKTNFALRSAMSLNKRNYYYIATARAIDEEMIEKIKKHKEERDEKWITIEEPIDLTCAFREISENSSVVVDCITTWLTNLIVEERNIEFETELFLSLLSKFREINQIHIFIVTNEVGMGVIPEAFLGRKFLNIAGIFNQRLMKISDEAYFMIAGRELRIK